MATAIIEKASFFLRERLNLRAFPTQQHKTGERRRREQASGMESGQALTNDTSLPALPNLQTLVLDDLKRDQ
jgi:hypothetical protein